jgi:hypothetical protein
VRQIPFTPPQPQQCPARWQASTLPAQPIPLPSAPAFRSVGSAAPRPLLPRPLSRPNSTASPCTTQNCSSAWWDARWSQSMSPIGSGSSHSSGEPQGQHACGACCPPNTPAGSRRIPPTDCCCCLCQIAGTGSKPWVIGCMCVALQHLHACLKSCLLQGWACMQPALLLVLAATMAALLLQVPLLQAHRPSSGPPLLCTALLCLPACC